MVGFFTLVSLAAAGTGGEVNFFEKEI